MIRVLASGMGVEPNVEHLPLQPGDVTQTWANVDKARRLLGYAPSTSFEAGIETFLEWFLASPALRQ